MVKHASAPVPPGLSSEGRLSETLLWQAQRAYFERAGINAWRSARVPHYITSNPALAHAIAQLCLALLATDDEADDETAQPLHIVELGAGSGRFTYLFLRALCALRAASPWSHRRFRYVVTDVAASNLAFLRTHPQLRPDIEAGRLDSAQFDVVSDDELTLHATRQTLRKGDLRAPIIVLANYVFDGVPHDAFSFQDGQLHEALVSLHATDESIADSGADFGADSGADSIGLGADDFFSRVKLRYRRQPASADYYPEPAYNRILQDYAQALRGGTLLFPIAALRCIERLAALSQTGLLLIAADRGSLDKNEVAQPRDPPLHVHGSFSFDVNLHAIAAWFAQTGGQVLQTEHRQFGLPLAALSHGLAPRAAQALRFAFELAFAGGSCDDFFCLREGIEPHYGKLDIEHLLSLLRLSRHDPRILAYCLPALQREAASLSSELRRDLIAVCEKIFANYFHIGEKLDLPFELGCLLYTLGAPQPALRFFGESLRYYGESVPVLWNTARCLLALQRPDEAERYLAQLHALQPAFSPPCDLLPKEY